jgi:hypothetical protein
LLNVAVDMAVEEDSMVEAAEAFTVVVAALTVVDFLEVGEDSAGVEDSIGAADLATPDVRVSAAVGALLAADTREAGSLREVMADLNTEVPASAADRLPVCTVGVSAARAAPREFAMLMRTGAGTRLEILTA